MKRVCSLEDNLTICLRIWEMKIIPWKMFAYDVYIVVGGRRNERVSAEHDCVL